MNISSPPATANGGASTTSEPAGLSKVRKNYNDLQDLLQQLPNKLSNVSSRIDEEFLSSYRVHMLSIQSELKKLKHDVTRGEQVLNSDVTVAKLEQETKWFSEECNRLKVHHDAMQKDCDQMKERLRAMIEQKEFLANQLKALMKRNKVLENEIESMKCGDAQSLVSGWNKSKSSTKGRYTPLDTMKLMENLPHQDTFPIPAEGSPYFHGSAEFGSEFELPPIDMDDEELEGLLVSHKPFFDNSRKLAEKDALEEGILQVSSMVARPTPLKIPSSPSNQQMFAPNSPSRSVRSSSPLRKSLKQQIIDSDGLLVQSILPPHHLRKSKQSFSLPNLVVAKSQDFEDAQGWPSFAVEAADEFQDFSQPQVDKRNEKIFLSATTGGLGMMNRQYDRTSSSRAPLSPSRKSFSANGAQDIQNQRIDVELFLEDAIKEIYQDICDRKQRANTASSTRKSPDMRTTVNLPSPTHRNTASSSQLPRSRQLSPTSPRKVLSTPDLLLSHADHGENVINQMNKLHEKTSFLGTKFGPNKHKLISKKRRESLNASTQTSMLSAIQGVIRTHDDDHHLRIDPKIRLEGGLSKLGTDQFSENDRFAAMVKFLSYPTVFATVVEALQRKIEG